VRSTLSPAEQIRARHLVAHLHGLGPRPVYEALREVAAGRPLLECLDAYARLDRNIVIALGADRMPAPPFTVVKGGCDD
jgi:hypothetical protein